jgi:hypothetical protein
LAAAEKRLEIDNSTDRINCARRRLESNPSSSISIGPRENLVHMVNCTSEEESLISPLIRDGDTMRSQSLTSSFWPTNPQPTAIENSRKSTRGGRQVMRNSAQLVEPTQPDEFHVSTH